MNKFKEIAKTVACKEFLSETEKQKRIADAIAAVQPFVNKKEAEFNELIEFFKELNVRTDLDSDIHTELWTDKNNKPFVKLFIKIRLVIYFTNNANVIVFKTLFMNDVEHEPNYKKYSLNDFLISYSLEDCFKSFAEKNKSEWNILLGVNN